MISEQVWDRQEKSAAGFRFGARTGPATPLAWSDGSVYSAGINLDVAEILKRRRSLQRVI